ncbi:MAG: Fe-S cluster assembly ATPase SufC [archaeon]
MQNILEIRELEAGIGGKKILNGVSLTIREGEVHAIMGPNGSGKSTLANVLMGNPKYKVLSGKVRFRGKDLLEMEPEERARNGMFLSFQHPIEITGLQFSTFLRAALKARFPEKTFTVPEFKEAVAEGMKEMGMKEEFFKRELNVGFSGGEKKRAEILQMMVLRPEMAILDETDSGLDIDSLRVVANGINRLRGKNFSGLVITHYKRILNYVKPDYVHVFMDGKIAQSGNSELADKLEEKGYGWVTNENESEGEQ